jgi:hypothetical protein
MVNGDDRPRRPELLDPHPDRPWSSRIRLGFAFFLGIPVGLDSLWGMIPAIITGVLLVVRTVLEDRTPQNQ